jgi:hypothetical protein
VTEIAVRAVQAMAQISKDAVALRLHPAHWPDALDRHDPMGGASLSRAIDTAAQAFEEYEAARITRALDRSLTPAAAEAANREDARKQVPGLVRALGDLRKRAESFEANRRRLAIEALGPAPTEPAHIALLQEIRARLKELPEHERTRHLSEFVARIDRNGVCAVLTAPAFLSGFKDEQVTALREQFFAAADPVRDAKHQAYRKAIIVADRAVEGVLRLLAHAAAEAPTTRAPASA